MAHEHTLRGATHYAYSSRDGDIEGKAFITTYETLAVQTNLFGRDSARFS